ncbi:hypothetical protein ACHAW5_007995 [Stephanodiscus triporus]|uniref:Uncharacterized protein n=1 Tax=Stephanodiscus triporus TaxID=2934178 RepID=A0ABD3PDD7_9STRA
MYKYTCTKEIVGYSVPFQPLIFSPHPSPA